MVIISTPVDLVPGGFSFNQYLVVDEEPLLFHTGPRRMFPLVRERRAWTGDGAGLIGELAARLEVGEMAAAATTAAKKRRTRRVRTG